MTWDSGLCKKGTRGNLTLTALSIHTFTIARGTISLWGLPSEKQTQFCSKSRERREIENLVQ